MSWRTFHSPCVEILWVTLLVMTPKAGELEEDCLKTTNSFDLITLPLCGWLSLLLRLLFLELCLQQVLYFIWGSFWRLFSSSHSTVYLFPSSNETLLLSKYKTAFQPSGPLIYGIIHFWFQHPFLFKLPLDLKIKAFIAENCKSPKSQLWRKKKKIPIFTEKKIYMKKIGR